MVEVSTEVGDGEIFGIVGPNGAGKTTLFNLITGLPVRPDDGRITFRGTDITHVAPEKIFRLGLARTFQRESSFEGLTVQENLEVGGVHGARRLRGRSLSRTVDAMLDRLDLGAIRRRPCKDLPLYDKKRLMVGSALMGEPSMLMLDEPVAGLTSTEADDFSALVLELNGEGITILIIEHVLPVLFKLALRVMVMDAGAVIAEGPPQAITRNARVIEAYLGPSGRSLFDGA